MREKNRKITFRVAFCGLVSGLSVVIMLTSTIVPIMTYAGPLIAMLLLIAAIHECGKKAAGLAYIATAILSVILLADKEAALFYAAVGYYPIVKAYFDRIQSRGLRMLAKFFFFLIVLGILYAVLIHFLGIDAVMGQLGDNKILATAGFVAVLSVVMLMFDYTFGKYTKMYKERIHPRLKFLGRLGAFILLAGLMIWARNDKAYANTKAVTYFGNEWAVNFLNSEHSQAVADFKQIRNDGFNTVIFCIPWREIQPGYGGSYNDKTIARVDELMNKAQAAGLKVMFRLGYTWDYYDSSSVLDRYKKVFTDSSTRNAWLAYAQKMYSVGSAHSNFKGAFITWEDFWNGLGSNYSNDYAKMDAALIKLLSDTQAVFPNLSMECRLDEDVRGGSRYSHSATFGCAGASYSSAMMSVSMGWENNKTVDPAAAVRNSSGIISKMQAAGKPVFIDQFLYMETTPGYESLAKVSDVNAYLAGMGSVFANQTMGYGIWTYRDYGDSIVYNPEFGMDFDGWSHGDGASIETVNGSRKACLEPGAVISQNFSGRGFISGKSTKAQVSVTAEEPGQLTVTVGGNSKVLDFAAGTSTVSCDFGSSVKGSINIKSSVKAYVDNVKVYSHVTEGNIYKLDGSAGGYLSGIRSMNSKN